ncbi:MAG: hypothetical protein IJD43_07200 [Thermoguttaceae bacterium]|nr:hypothetical protein [Thermoguttaceae bacterium]
MRLICMLLSVLWALSAYAAETKPSVPQTEEQEKEQAWDEFENALSSFIRYIENEELLPEGATEVPDYTYTLPKAETIRQRKLSKEHQKQCRKMRRQLDRLEKYYGRSFIFWNSAGRIAYYLDPNYGSDRKFLQYLWPIVDKGIFEEPVNRHSGYRILHSIYNRMERAVDYPKYTKDVLKNREKYTVRYLEILQTAYAQIKDLPTIKEVEEMLTEMRRMPEFKEIMWWRYWDPPKYTEDDLKNAPPEKAEKMRKDLEEYKLYQKYKELISLHSKLNFMDDHYGSSRYDIFVEITKLYLPPISPKDDLEKLISIIKNYQLDESKLYRMFPSELRERAKELLEASNK